MKVDPTKYLPSVNEAGNWAREAEVEGYDAWWATDTEVDSFLASVVAAERTERIVIGISIAVAFTVVRSAHPLGRTT